MPKPTKLTNAVLLKKIADAEGFPNVDTMLEHYAVAGSVPAACATCGAIHDGVEPDAENYPCEECENDTVQSVLILAEVI